MIYVSKPTTIEAVFWDGLNFTEMYEFAGEKVRVVESKVLALTAGGLELLAGKDGAQEWVPVPIGHWLVSPPSDRSDIWPVENEFFLSKYERKQ